MDKEILDEKEQFLLYFCKYYQDYGRGMIEADGIGSVKFFLIGLCNRAIALNMGFMDLTTSKYENYLAALPILRLMLDNAMAGYAFFLAGDSLEDRLKYLSFIKQGNDYNRYKVNKHKQLNEKTIINAMNHEIQGIRSLYKRGCSYIHYSNNLMNASAFMKREVDGRAQMFAHVNDVSGLFTEEERIGFWDDLIGANIYMMQVIVKWDDYIKETILPTLLRFVEENRDEMERLMREKGIDIPT